MHKMLQRVPRLVALAAYVCFACRIFVPVGYMPAALSEGGPFVLCHNGFQGELVRFLASRTGHHHSISTHEQGTQDDPTKASHEGLTHCPVGSTLHNIAFAGSHQPLDIFPAASSVLPPLIVAVVATSVARKQHIRAPPHSLPA